MDETQREALRERNRKRAHHLCRGCGSSLDLNALSEHPLGGDFRLAQCGSCGKEHTFVLDGDKLKRR